MQSVAQSSVRQKFRRADAKAQWALQYSYLCRHSQNSREIIEERHLVRGEEDERPKVDCFRGLTVEQAVLLVDLTGFIVAERTALLNEASSPDHTDTQSAREGLARLGERLEELRSLYSGVLSTQPAE